jgi:hypothetical protein
VSVVSDSKVLVMSVTIDGKSTTRKFFRRAKNGIKPQCLEKKIKLKSSNNHILKKVYDRKIFSYIPDNTLLTSNSKYNTYN